MFVILRLVFVGIAIISLQWLFFGRLDLWGATPDVVLLFVLWVAIQHGRVAGAIAGFLAGFALDAIYGLWGIHMFVKTLIGFLIGLLDMTDSHVFIRPVLRIVETTLVVSLVHNSLFAFFVIMQRDASWGHLLWVLSIGGTLYTTFIAFIIAALRRR